MITARMGKGPCQRGGEGGHVFALKPDFVANGKEGKAWLIVVPVLPREMGKGLSSVHIGMEV